MPENYDVLLARIDERTRILGENFTALVSNLEKHYATKDQLESFKREMKPIKTGFISIISTIAFIVIVTLVNSIIKK